MANRQKNGPLIIGGWLSMLAAALHIAIIFGGPDWYRAFGAGEQMAQMAAAGDAYPTLVTSFIALVLFIWAAYAFAGAGLMRRLPLMRTALIGITAIYLLRGLGVFLLMIIGLVQFNAFMVWSSTICTLYGMAYLMGTRKAWAQLSP